MAFSFSVALLGVLCVPRPAGWKPGDSLQQKLVKRGRRNVERFPDYDMSFMVAAGLLTLTPYNHYLYHNDNADTSTDKKCCTFDLRQCVIDSNTDYLLSNGTALKVVVVLALDAADGVDIVPHKLAEAAQQVAQGLVVAVGEDVVVAKKTATYAPFYKLLQHIDLFSY